MQRTIGQASEDSGIGIETIRYYEKEGLIARPTRTEGNFRTYESAAIEKLSFIKNCRALDLTLGEIKELILIQQSPETPCSAVNTMIDAHINIVESRISSLQKLHEDLQTLRQRCDDARAISECGILEKLSP